MGEENGVNKEIQQREWKEEAKELGIYSVAKSEVFLPH